MVDTVYLFISYDNEESDAFAFVADDDFSILHRSLFQNSNLKKYMCYLMRNQIRFSGTGRVSRCFKDSIITKLTAHRTNLALDYLYILYFICN